MAEKTLLEEVMEQTIKFMDANNKLIELKAADVYRAYCPKKATPEQLLEYKMKVEALNLDPRLGEVWMSIMDEKENQGGKWVKVGEKVVTMTSYMVYLRRAWASKLMDNFHVEIEKTDEKNPDTWKAKFTGWRTGMTQPFETEWIPVSELNKKRNVWNIMPTTMTIVRMTAMGLRWMLADVMGAMPYIEEEMTGGLAEIDDKDMRIENMATDEKQKDEMEKERESADNAKSAYLQTLSETIGKFSTIAKIDEYYNKNATSYKKSAFFEEIKSVYLGRKRDLADVIMAKNMNVDIQDLIAFKIAVNGDGIDNSLIEQILEDNKEACKELKTRIENWKKERDAKIDAEAAPESEVDDAEAALDDMADTRASEA